MMRRRLLKYLEILFAATLAIAGAASGDVDPASVSFTEPSTTDPPMNWHTFIGGPVSFDSGSAVVLDSAGNVFVAGSSMTRWGVPLNPYSGMTDIVVAKFDASGRLQWHTFLGGSSGDDASDLAVDDAGNLFLVGSSEASWGTPLNPHADDNHSDIVVAKLDIAGRLQWHTFVGGSLSDWSGSLSVDSVGDLFIAGQSHGSWGAPLNPHAGDSDLFGREA